MALLETNNYVINQDSYVRLYHLLYQTIMYLYVSFKTIVRTFYFFFFFNEPPTTEIYTLSLHDALPISNAAPAPRRAAGRTSGLRSASRAGHGIRDRKSTRLNSSHDSTSYAVFCLK